VDDRAAGRPTAAVALYFVAQDGACFQARLPFAPYMYLAVEPGREGEVDSYLRRAHGGAVRSTEVVSRADLDLKNHLAGVRRTLVKVTFWTTAGLGDVRRAVLPAARRNRARAARAAAAAGTGGAAADAGAAPGDDPFAGPAGPPRSGADALTAITDVREHDVPYHVRFAIDAGVRCGHWYTVTARGGAITLARRADLERRAEPVVCAFDIETTKLPLQFPNADYDQVFMISYMVDGRGYLVCNREVVGADVADFEYTPKADFPGPFEVANVPNEAALLTHFFAHMRAVKPGVYVTYNGDWFDFPFVARRAKVHGMSIADEIGFKPPDGDDIGPGEWLSRTAVHMDCLHWVREGAGEGGEGGRGGGRARGGAAPPPTHPPPPRPPPPQTPPTRPPAGNR